jgi:hypothetical protein
MPLQKLQFRPGINREGTDYSNEGGWYACDKVRFRSGFPEKIGGWIRLSNQTFLGVCRALWNWVTLNGANLLGVGTNLKYYIEQGGDYNDITPIRETFTHASTPTTDNCIATINGSNLITVNYPNYGGVSGDFVTISGAAAVGGIPADELNSEHQITYVDLDTFTFLVTSNATSTVAAGGGATITMAFQINTGLDVYVVGNGWGAGTWPSYINTTLTDPFTCASTGVQVLTVTQASHGLTTGDYVYFVSIASNPCGINRLILQKAFQITNTGTNTYTINISSITASTTTSTAASGGSVVVSTPVAPVRGWGTAADVGIGQQLRLWTNDNFGEDLLIAPRGGAIYYWDATTGISVRAELLNDVSTAKGYAGQFVPNKTNQIIGSAIQRFAIAFGANPYDPADSNNIFDPLLVRWSDQENPFEWVPAATNQSGEYRLNIGSYIMCAESTRQEILVWSDAAIYSMQYLGPPYVWGFQLLQDNISIMSPNASITVNNITYWMGTDKFFMYSGRVETLPCAVWQYIFDDINKDQSFQVFAGSNESYSEVWWFYCSNNSNTVDKYVIYNYLERTWSYGSMNRTAWLDSGLRQYPMAATYAANAQFTGYITGTTLTVTSVASGTIAIDDYVFGSGVTRNTQITAFGTGIGATGTYTINNTQSVASTSMYSTAEDGRVLYHEANVDDVSGLTPVPIEAFIQSSDFDIGDGHNFGFVWRILPDITFNGSSANQPTVTMTVRPRRNSGTPYGLADNPQVQSAQNYTNRGTYDVQEFDGQVYTRLRGRQMSFRIESTTLGVAWQLGTPRIDIRNDGRR